METIDILWIISKSIFILGICGLIYSLISLLKSGYFLDKAEYHLGIAKKAIQDNMISNKIEKDRPLIENFEVGGEKISNYIDCGLTDRAKIFLKEKNINIDKVRFIFAPSFIYCREDDAINPKQNFQAVRGIVYSMNFKLDGKKIVNKEYERIIVKSHHRNDIDWNDLKDKINNSNLGYVFMLLDPKNFDFYEDNYHFELDTKEVRYTEIM